MSTTTADVLNAIYLVLFGLAVGVSAVTILIRMNEHLRRNRPIPRLMPRDLALMVGLLVPFGIILVDRVFEFGLRGDPVWQAISGAAAVGGVGVFVWYELFVIGTGRE